MFRKKKRVIRRARVFGGRGASSKGKLSKVKKLIRLAAARARRKPKKKRRFF